MNFNSKKTSLIILGITAIVCSRAMFAFFNDPEGPNLLIVVGMAVIVYALSLGVVRLLGSSTTGLKKILLTVLIQIVIVSGLYFFLN